MKKARLLSLFCMIIFLPALLAQPVSASIHHDGEIDWAYYEEQGIEPFAAERLVNERGESILNFIPATGILLIPESSNEKVMAFDPEDGSLIDEFFFPGDDVNLTTPIHLIWNFNGTSFLISDQTMRLVQQFSTDGVFEETFAPQGGEDSNILNNIRGMYMKPNGNLLVTVAGGGNTNSVAMFDTEGAYLGNFVDNNVGGLNGPWAIVYRNDFNDYLVSASGSSGVHRYDTDGDFIEMFATGLAFPQQMQELDNGNILVTNFSSPSGVYEYQSDGTQIGYYGVVTGLRGVRELGNGNIMVTNSGGVHIINRNNQLLETVASGQARHISFIQPMDMDFFNLNLEMNPEDAGTVQGAGNYPEDHMVTVTATPNVFHEFINWTDSDGAEVSDQASFQFQMPGEDVTLTANFAVLDTYSVNFTVVEDSADEDPIEGATISIDGFDPMETDADGEASIMLPVGSYTAGISKQGYVAESVDIVVTDDDVHVTVHMMDVILPPANVEVTTEDLGPGEALLTWVDPASVVEFRYDDGVVDGQLGFQGTWNSVMGAVHFNNAIIEEMTWYLTSEGGPHSTVKVWVLGLDASGLPNRNNIVYTAENIPNTDNQWNSYTFSEPIEMPEGFFIGISYPGFLGLATDDGVGEPWDFVPGTQFGVFNITDPTSAFTDISVWGFQVNYLLRAYGLDFGEVSYSKGQIAEAGGPAPEFIPMDKPVDAGHPKDHNNKAFLGFNVYLNDDLIAEEIAETEYMFTNLPAGEHTAGVQTVYTTGTSEIVTADFEIDVYEYFTVTFVVTDEDEVPITDAIITFDGVTYDPGHYVFENLAPGTYSYMVEKEGYLTVQGQTTLENDITIPVVLIADIELFEVTFHVDLTNAILHGLLEGFDPDVHHIYITGSMIGWPEPGTDPENQLMEWLTADPMVFGITHHLEAGTYEYKYFSDLIGDGWDGGEWVGDPNRVVEVDADMLVEDMFGPDDLDVIDLDEVTMLLYPNPAHSTLHIESNTEILDIRMVDMLGQVVFSAPVNDVRHQVNVSRFNTGIYFIQLTTRAGVVTHRVQVTR
ncbi:MAG: T9SS C-terminal target domain-containing protein [Bacteroidia bacterium]|nr:MAG: T9SS C-terminal target domain-containing protein [Bacteroidia bacterium]